MPAQVSLPSPPAQPLLVDSRTAARLLSVSPRTVFSMTAAGELPCVRLGRLVRYALADLERVIDSRRQLA